MLSPPNIVMMNPNWRITQKWEAIDILKYDQNNKVYSCPDIIEILQTLGEPLILNKFIESGDTDKGRAAARVDWGHIKGGSYHLHGIIISL